MQNAAATIKFTGINIVSKEFKEPPNQQVPQQFLFDIKVEAKVNAPMRLVMPHTYVGIRADNSTEYLAQFTIACYFEIGDFENLIRLNDKKQYVVPRDLDFTLRGAALSTSRGVIFSELRGTYLHNTILPLVLVHNFIPNEAPVK